MKFSIVTLSFNQARYLPQAVESVLGQGEDVEYVVVDAGSTDGSLTYLKTVEVHLAKLVVEPDDGPADGLNKGLALSTGDIFYYLNSDDVLAPGALAFVKRFLCDNAAVDVLAGAVDVIDDAGRVTGRFRSDPWKTRSYLYGATVVAQQATFIRRSALDNVYFNRLNRTCWDGELLLDLARQGACFATTDQVLGQFRVHPESITGSQRLKRLYMDDHERLFRREYGHGYRVHDRVLALGYRAAKRVRGR